MKKFRTVAIVLFMLFFTVVSVQAEVLNSLKFTANSGTVSSSGGTYTLTDFTERATMQADISDAVRKAVGENGGSGFLPGIGKTCERQRAEYHNVPFWYGQFQQYAGNRKHLALLHG